MLLEQNDCVIIKIVYDIFCQINFNFFFDLIENKFVGILIGNGKLDNGNVKMLFDFYFIIS